MLCGKRLKQYSRRERNLIYTILFLICLVFIFIIILIAKRGNSICLTATCVKAATYVQNSIDPSVDPCDNFYEFACGNFLKNSILLEQPTQLNHLNNLKNRQLRQIVSEDEGNKEIPKSLYYQRAFYRACKNTTAIDDDEDETFLNVLEDIIGGWPLIKGNAWNERDFDWIKAMEKAREMGMDHRFFFEVSVSLENSTKILKISPYTNSIKLGNYTNKFENIIYKMGSRIIGISSQLRLVNTFSEQLYEATERAKNISMEHGDKEHTKTTISKLKNIRFIKLHWLQFLKEFTGIHNLKESDEILIDVSMDEYFEELYYLLLKTPKRVLANYIAILLMQQFSGYLSKDVRDAFPKTRKSGKIIGRNLTRSDFCYDEALELFPTVAEGEYIRRYANKEVRDNVKTMAKYIKEELKYAILSNTFMDEESRERSVEILKNITENVGWTDTVRDVKKFESVFGYDKIYFSTANNALTMARKMKKFARDRKYQNTDFLTTIYEHPDVEVNAYFLPTYNYSMLPAPILQPPFFDLKGPKYLNYGALGDVIGHEFTHAFSDLTWNLPIVNEHGFWTNQTIKQYKDLTKCVVEEYENYPELLDNFSKNGSKVQREIEADFNGINIAYRAYQKWTYENGDENFLPGLPYTPNQLFWITNGALYCYQYELRDLDVVVNIDMFHPVPSFRVMGSMRNSPYFADDFRCAKGTRMNPEKKCKIYF